MSIACRVRKQHPGFVLDLDLLLAHRATGVFGPSGAGKSTLLGCLGGFITPDAGRIVCDDLVLYDRQSGIDLPTHRRRLGVVFQHGHLLPHRNVLGNLRYGHDLLPTAERRLRPDHVIDLLGLAPLLAKRPRDCSGGERQRIALGRALLCSPRVLLLDEPLSALDRGLKRQILPYLRRVRRELGIPTIHVSHDLAELTTTCDELVLLDRGRVVAQGTPTQLATHAEALPLLHDLGLALPLPGRVLRHDDGLSWIDIGASQAVACGLLTAAIGDEVELLLHPHDVALARMPVPGCTLQNQVPGRITAITSAPDRAIIAVDTGAIILAEISAAGLHSQRLMVGDAVWCLFKALAISADG